jgi:hypothetical protein
MWKITLIFLFSPLLSQEFPFLTKKELVVLSKEATPPDPLPKKESRPYFNNELVDSFNRPYKRFVFKGSYSEGRDPYNEGGGAVCYYYNSYLYFKTGPSYNKINYKEKFWKLNAQVNLEFPVFPLKAYTFF